MGNAPKIDAFLRQHKGVHYCDLCLSKLTGIKPAHQALALNSEFNRKSDYKCANCAGIRACIAYVGTPTSSVQSYYFA